VFATSQADVNPLFQPYVAFWADWVEKANETTQRVVEGAQNGADPKAWQRRWMEAVSKSIDAYLRSPMFLNAMKGMMDAAVKTKMNVDDLQKEFARNANIPTASDVSGLFERLRGVEELVLQRLGEISDRLVAIEQRLKG
jgi:hypothetical protein